MSYVKACRGCLETDGKLLISNKELREIFHEFIGSPNTIGDDLPLYICVVCLHLIKKFKMFKHKCCKASIKLQQLHSNKQLTIQNIKLLFMEDYGNNFNATSPEVHSYLPLIKAFDTTTFHFDISETKDEILGEALTVINNEYHLNNYCDSIVEDVIIKKELPNEDASKNTSNVKIFIFNHDNLINNDKNDIDFTNETEDNFSFNEYESNVEIKEEIVEETKNTKLRKRKRDKCNTVTANTQYKVKHEFNKEKKRILVNRILKNKKKEEEVGEEIQDSVEKRYEESDQTRKNAAMFYNTHPEKQIPKEKLQKRMDMLERFSKAYNVDVKFLTQEEQEMELEQRKTFYKDFPYICTLCFRGYSIQDTYNSHMEVHHPSTGDYECHVCKIRCKSSRDREKHVNATHLKRFTCRQCGIVTKSQSYARAHFARHEGASFTCDQCGKKFTQQTNYLSHMRLVHSDRVRVCPLCYDTFRGPAGLRVHIGIVHKQAVRCTSCQSQFDTEKALNKHLETSVDNTCEPGIRSCPMCGLNFESEKLMKKHYEDLHKTELKCNKCGKLFPSKIRLSTHIQEHKRSAELTNNAGKIICESCGKDFRNMNLLRYHQRLHTGERPYQCTHCAKTFRLAHLLQCHMSVHTDERRYKCPMCPKAFRQPAHRTAHLLTHTKERPYACSACPKRYTSASAAREHADTVHRGLPARRRDKNKDT